MKNEVAGALSYHVAEVSAVNLELAAVRVKVAELDNLESWWLQVLQQFSGANHAYVMPHVGDQVAVLLDVEGSRGCMIGAVYSQRVPPAETGANLHATRITTTRITGDVEITGNVTIVGNVDTEGDTSTQGAVKVEGSHSINNKDTVVVGSKDSGGDTNSESGQ